VIVSWRRRRIASGKRGVDSWHFIALAVAAIAIGAATYGIGLRSSRPPGEAKSRPSLLIEKATVIVKVDSDAEQTFGFVLIPRTTTMELMRANRNNLDRRAEDRQPVPVLNGDNLKLMTETDGDR